MLVTELDEIVAQMKRNPKNVSFKDICKVCDLYFGQPRQAGTSHRVYKMPWAGDPRINLQKEGSRAKAYQVKQVLKAIERLEADNGIRE